MIYEQCLRDLSVIIVEFRIKHKISWNNFNISGSIIPLNYNKLKIDGLSPDLTIREFNKICDGLYTQLRECVELYKIKDTIKIEMDKHIDIGHLVFSYKTEAYIEVYHIN